MIICAGNNEIFDFATPMGVGMVDMSINLTKYVMMTQPERLLFIGSAGSYGEHNIFDIVESKTATNIENSFFRGAYTPIDNMISTSSDVSRETIVNSSNYITTEKTLSEKYLNYKIFLENMEFFAFLKVAQAFEIPAGGVFIVTNYCDEYAHETFLKNHKMAMEKLINYIKERIQV